MKVWPLALFALVGGVALGLPLLTQPDPNRVPTTDEVASRMMSPFCPGLTLEECPSDQATRVRGEIDEMVSRGATNREIDRWIVANFGEVALARPGPSLAWVVPPLVAVAGAAVVVVGLRRVARKTQRGRPVELTEEEETLFERDFATFRRGSE